jgi:hypothetical protein
VQVIRAVACGLAMETTCRAVLDPVAEGGCPHVVLKMFLQEHSVDTLIFLMGNYDFTMINRVFV